MGRVSRSVWVERVERFNESGLTLKAFAAEIGVNDRTLSYWKCKLAKEAAATRPPRGASRSRATKRAPKFVEVTPGFLGGDTPIELVVTERYMIRVSVGFEPETLRRVLSVLEGST